MCRQTGQRECWQLPFLPFPNSFFRNQTTHTGREANAQHGGVTNGGRRRRRRRVPRNTNNDQPYSPISPTSPAPSLPLRISVN